WRVPGLALYIKWIIVSQNTCVIGCSNSCSDRVHALKRAVAQIFKIHKAVIVRKWSASTAANHFGGDGFVCVIGGCADMFAVHHAGVNNVSLRIGNLNRRHERLKFAAFWHQGPSLFIDSSLTVACDPALVDQSHGAAIRHALDPLCIQRRGEWRVRHWCNDNAVYCFANHSVGFSVAEFMGIPSQLLLCEQILGNEKETGKSEKSRKRDSAHANHPRMGKFSMKCSISRIRSVPDRDAGLGR